MQIQKINFSFTDKVFYIDEFSTLFTLFKLDEHMKNYYFIFDQLGTDECRAFNNFNVSKQKDYDLYLASMWNHGPEVVFGKYKN